MYEMSNTGSLKSISYLKLQTEELLNLMKALWYLSLSLYIGYECFDFL